MTIPDKLIQAVVESKCLLADTAGAPEDGSCSYEYEGFYHPECAIAAAFAALPDCEEAKSSDGFTAAYRTGWDDCLAELARVAAS